MTNQAYGAGFNSDGVPVVDRLYLELVMSDGEYVADNLIHGQSGARTAAMGYLYKDQADLGRMLSNLLNDPVVMRRFKGRFEWDKMPIPVWGGGFIYSSIPVMRQTEEEQRLVERLSPLLPNGGRV